MSERALLLDKETQLHLAVELYLRGLFGIQENPEDYIPLKSGRRSPHYLDVRPGISNETSRTLIARHMFNLAIKRTKQHDKNATKLNHVYRHVAGNPEAMTSYMPKIAEIGHISLLQPRVHSEKSGNKTPILGVYRSGDRVALFNDVVTEGESVLNVVNQVNDTGLVVADYFVALDREEGGSPMVNETIGLEITPALAVSGVVTMLYAENLISDTQHDNVLEYMVEYGEPQAQKALGIAAKR